MTRRDLDALAKESSRRLLVKAGSTTTIGRASPPNSRDLWRKLAQTAAAMLGEGEVDGSPVGARQ